MKTKLIIVVCVLLVSCVETTIYQVEFEVRDAAGSRVGEFPFRIDPLPKKRYSDSTDFKYFEIHSRQKIRIYHLQADGPQMQLNYIGYPFYENDSLYQYKMVSSPRKEIVPGPNKFVFLVRKEKI